MLWLAATNLLTTKKGAFGPAKWRLHSPSGRQWRSSWSKSWPLWRWRKVRIQPGISSWIPGRMRGFGLGLGSTMGLTSERIVWRCGSSWPPQGMVCWSAVRAPTAHAPAQRLCIVCKYVCARPYLIKIIPRSIHYMLSVSWNTIFTVRKICTYAAGYVFISCIKTIQLTKQNIATPSSGICGAGSKLLPKRFWRLGEFPCLLAARPRRKRLLGELLLLRGWIFRGCRCHSNNSSSCSVWPAPCDAWSPSETCRDQDLGNNGELKVLHLTRKTSKGKNEKN